MGRIVVSLYSPRFFPLENMKNTRARAALEAKSRNEVLAFRPRPLFLHLDIGPLMGSTATAGRHSGSAAEVEECQ